jgi:hypothetical protein
VLGRPGRGHPNQYWMVCKRSTATDHLGDEKRSTATDHKKGPREPRKGPFGGRKRSAATDQNYYNHKIAAKKLAQFEAAKRQAELRPKGPEELLADFRRERDAHAAANGPLRVAAEEISIQPSEGPSEPHQGDAKVQSATEQVNQEKTDGWRTPDARACNSKGCKMTDQEWEAASHAERLKHIEDLERRPPNYDNDFLDRPPEERAKVIAWCESGHVDYIAGLRADAERRWARDSSQQVEEGKL